MKRVSLLLITLLGLSAAQASSPSESLVIQCASEALTLVGQFQKTESKDFTSLFQGSIQVSGVETAFNEVTPAQLTVKHYPAGTMYKNFDNTIVEMIVSNKGESVAFKSSLNVKAVRNDLLAINRKVIKAKCEIK